MYARVMISQVDPSKWVEVVQVAYDVAREAQQQRGFVSYQGLGDQASGKAITITLWETEADRDASGEGSEYLKAQLAKVAPYFTAPPIITNCVLMLAV